MNSYTWNFTCVFSVSHEKLSLVLLHITNYVYIPWKVKSFFCPLKITITQFPDRFCLIQYVFNNFFFVRTWRWIYSHGPLENSEVTWLWFSVQLFYPCHLVYVVFFLFQCSYSCIIFIVSTTFTCITTMRLMGDLSLGHALSFHILFIWCETHTAVLPW